VRLVTAAGTCSLMTSSRDDVTLTTTLSSEQLRSIGLPTRSALGASEQKYISKNSFLRRDDSFEFF